MPSKMFYCGIDPGSRGALAILNSDGSIRSYEPFNKNYDEIAEMLLEIKPNIKRLYLEKVHAQPGNGVVSMFSFGREFGIILGILEAFDIKYSLVAASTWHRIVVGRKELGTPKEKSLNKAKEIWPTDTFIPPGRYRTPHDGVIDALMIARYGLIKDRNEA